MVVLVSYVCGLALIFLRVARLSGAFWRERKLHARARPSYLLTHGSIRIIIS